MKLDEELARLEFLGVHTIQEHAFARLLSQVFTVEFGCHRAPDFRTLHVTSSTPHNLQNEMNSAYLDVGDVSLRRELHPIRLIEFRTNHIVQVRNFVVLTYEGRWVKVAGSK